MSSFNDFVQIIKRLRAPDGCPWDKEQTLETLTPHIIEEAYELVDAIQKQDYKALIGELGDVLLHVVMLSNIAEELGHFSVFNVVEYETEKMIRRHPHVFGDQSVNSVDEVWETWETIKSKESEDTILASVPKVLPGLMRAEKIQKKVSRHGFDWTDHKDVIEKVKEEIDEFSHERILKNEAKMTEEFGDLLFSLVNLGRKLGISSERALQMANQKFQDRFTQVERLVIAEGKQVRELSLAELNERWETVKEKG